MYNNNGATSRAAWEVLWIKNGKVQRKDCGHDLGEASKIYARVVSAGRKGATLRCKNMAFPPPDHYADREVVELVHPRTGRKVRGKRIITPRRYETRMLHMNRRGIWWCPYCMQMRHFVKKRGFYVGGVWNDSPHLACPICGASHMIVRKYNPMSDLITARVKKPATQRSSERARRRRARAAEEDEDE